MTDFPKLLFHYKQGFISLVTDSLHQEQLVKQMGGVFTSYSISRVRNWEELKDRAYIRESDLDVERSPL